MLKYLIFDRGDTIIADLPESYGGMADWPYYKPIDGVLETLPQLCEIYICIMASNTSVSTSCTIKSALKKMGLDTCFKIVFTQDDLSCAKPNKDFFINILKKLKATPNEVCSIGNSYQLDIVPAKELGITTILLTSKKDTYPCADYVIKSFNEIKEILLDNIN